MSPARVLPFPGDEASEAAEPAARAAEVRHPNATTRSAHLRVLDVVAVIVLLALPVQYRGGAAMPHPHALLQLWTPGGHGLVHHEPPAERLMSGSHDAAEATPRPRHLVGSPGPGAPTLSAMTSPGESAAVIGAIALSGPVLLLERSRCCGEVARRLAGITFRPTDPPPRRSAFPC